MSKDGKNQLPVNVLVVFIHFLADEACLLLDGGQSAANGVQSLILLPHNQLGAESVTRSQRTLISSPSALLESIALDRPLVLAKWVAQGMEVGATVHNQTLVWRT